MKNITITLREEIADWLRVEAAKADIIAGKIVVHDYMSDNSCK